MPPLDLVPVWTIILGVSVFMTTSERDASIVRSTIHLAHDLGLDVIAEGVESAEALAAITQLGCDRAQGYAIAVPASGDTVAEWARSTGRA